MWKNGLRKADFGLRGGYGSLHEPILCSALRTRAYGPHLSWQGFLDRRWLFTSDLKVYSRPYVYLYPRMRVIVYSRPCAWFGWKRSALLWDVRHTPEDQSPWPWGQAVLGLYEIFKPVCANFPSILAAIRPPPPRSPRSSRNIESESTGACRSEANPEYRICLKPSYLTNKISISDRQR